MATNHFGGLDVAPAIAGCSGSHGRVLWLGEGDHQLRGSRRGAIAGCHCRVPLEGRVTTNFGEWTWCHCWVPLQGAIVVCYGWGRRVTTNFGGVDVVPWLGAIAGCHWREGDDQLWGSGRGAVVGCHCRVPL